MALGLQTESGGGGDYADIIKFDARAGRMFRVDRSNDSGQWETNNVEITNGFQAVFDLDNVQVGWALFAAGQAPSFSMVPLGGPFPAKPSENHKQAFKIMVKLGKGSGGDVRELSSQAKVVIGALDNLHTAFEAQKAANPGKLPVVALTGSTAVVSQGKGQSSTNYAPVFEIVKWVDRPPELAPPKATQVAQTATTSTAPAAAATAPVQAPAMATADEEF